MVIYSMDVNAVDPIFYPVVPDSFMRREPGGVTASAARSHAEWPEEVERPLLSPSDRWSF